MRVRLWSASTRTGQIMGEIKNASGSFVAELGGGECRLTVGLDHLLTSDGARMDVGAVQFVHGLLIPGARTIVATDEFNRCLGEWIVDVREGSSPEGSLKVTGVGWAVLPSLKAQRAVVGYDRTDQFTIARALLGAAFNHQDNIVTFEGGLSGVKRDLESPARTAYYGDLLDELANADNGFQWAVDTSAQWVGDAPVSVTRRVLLGHPVLDRGPSVAVFDQDVPGSNGGAAVKITGGQRWTRTAQEITGVGGLDGGAGPRRTISAPSTGMSERLSIDKIVSFPAALKVGALEALIRDELGRSASSAEQFSATGWADRMNLWPRPGGVAWLFANATWVYPTGINLFVRIGRVSWQVDLDEVQTVTILGVDGSDWENPEAT